MTRSYLSSCASDKRFTLRMSNVNNILNSPLTMLSSEVQISHLISFSTGYKWPDNSQKSI